MGNKGEKLKVVIKKMDGDFNPQVIKHGDWVASDYGEGNKRKQNEQIRKSQYCWASILIDEKLPIQNTNDRSNWKLIRYTHGKFVEHRDSEKMRNHVGTEILIFPKSKSPHSSGALRIYTDNQQTEVIAQQQVYVYVFLPLGVRHEVTTVEGVRTVATRIVTQEQNESEEEKIYRENMRKNRSNDLED